VLILTPSRELGGTEAHLEAIARGALEAGEHVAVAMADLPALAPLHASLRATGAEVLDLRLGERRASRAGAVAALLRDTVAVGWLLARRRPDAVLVELPDPDASPGALLACALSRVPTLALFHLVRPDAGTIAGNVRRLYALIRRLGQRWAVVSPDNRRSLARLFAMPEDDIAVIDNGVPHYDRDPTARARARAGLGASDDDIVVLTVGRLSEQKGHATIVEALPALLAATPSLLLCWAGAGALEGKLRAAVAAAGHGDRVGLLGRREDIGDLLAAADLFLFPSRFEGAPLALLEAMAAGVPVLVSDIGAHRDLVRDGETGLLFAVDDAAALAARVTWAAAHPEEMAALAARAQPLVRERHSEGAMLARTLELLRGRA
jgi:glycosyltransferase involved in cell wall biosynthesis